jgi:hypothetical protein
MERKNRSETRREENAACFVWEKRSTALVVGIVERNNSAESNPEA